MKICRGPLTKCTDLVLLLFIISIATVNADACYPTGWSYLIQKCFEGYVEVYRDQRKYDGMWESLCCQTGSDEEKGQRLYADACLQATCASNKEVNDRDQCDVGIPNRRYINGKEMNLVEVTRDQCMGEDGQVGVKVLCCPENSTDTLLTTLYGAEPLEFPHFARVGTYGCGGTVYNEQWILTAAHCVVNHQTRKVKSVKQDGQKEWEECCAQVRINVEISDAYTENTYNVTKIVVHPNSSWLQPEDLSKSYNDVALMKLDKKIKFGKNVKALRIAEPGFDPLKYGKRVVIVGFGTTDTLRGSQKQQKANLLIRSKNDVNFLVNYHDQMLFVGGMLDGSVSPSVGQGDSGGPAICRDADGMAVLCGVTSLIVSATETCKATLEEADCAPSVYNDVQYFNPWIQSVAGKQDEALMLQQPLFGQAVNKNEFPAHVHVISKNGGDPCGGTLIAEDVVLTTASCAVDLEGSPRQGLKVVTGVMDLKKGGGKTISVTGVGPMQGFKRVSREGVRNKRVVSLILESWQRGKLDAKFIRKEPYYKNNLALLKLAEKSGMASKIAQLAKNSPKNGEMALEVAFPYEALGTVSKGKIPLSKRQFKMLDQVDCQKRINRLSPIDYNVKLDDNVACGVERYSGGSLCDRELGGGLYCQGQDGKQLLCGVQMFRLCEFNIPNGFMDVAKVRDWLDTALTYMDNMKAEE